MNLGCVGQTFLSADSGDFPVARSRNTGQECPVNPQAGKPALRFRVGSWTQCIRKNERGLSMNRKMLPLQMNKLRILGSWSQCIRKIERELSMCQYVGRTVLSPPGPGALRTPS